MLDNKLIESALQLTGKTMEEMEIVEATNNGFVRYFSMPNFCYYLLSPEFIEKYSKIHNRDFIYTSEDIGFAIYEYQSGNEQLLIDLLSKI